MPPSCRLVFLLLAGFCVPRGPGSGTLGVRRPVCGVRMVDSRRRPLCRVCGAMCRRLQA